MVVIVVTMLLVIEVEEDRLKKVDRGEDVTTVTSVEGVVKVDPKLDVVTSLTVVEEANVAVSPL